MANYGNIAKAFNAQHVKLQIGTEANEWILLTNISKRSVAGRTNIQNRSGVAYFFSDNIREVTCEGIVSQDIYNYLVAANTRDSYGNLPSNPYTVWGQSLSGSTSDDITAEFNAYLHDLEDRAAEEGSYMVRFTLTIINSTYIPQVSPPE